MNRTKYLGIYLDKYLSWNSHLSQLKTKLSRGCGLLAKLHYYINTTTLRSVDFAIFDAHLRYGSQIWGQHKTGIHGLVFPQINIIMKLQVLHRVTS